MARSLSSRSLAVRQTLRTTTRPSLHHSINYCLAFITFTIGSVYWIKSYDTINNKFYRQFYRSEDCFNKRYNLFESFNKCLTPLLSPFVSIRRANLWFKRDGKEISMPVMVGDQYQIIPNVAERVSPAVVYIEVKGSVHVVPEMNVPDSYGSGFVIHPSGLILTSAHVVEDAPFVSVTLFDGRILKGRVECLDFNYDLATVRLETSDETLPYIKLGDSHKSRAGEWVIAIGNPILLMNTISVGVISSLRRKASEQNWNWYFVGKDIDLIQTDASINGGNSGGPLLNLSGEAIGVINSRITGKECLTFAIPSNYAKEFIERANQYNEDTEKSEEISSKGNRYIGISMLSLTPELMDDLKLSDNLPNVSNGILVWKVMVDSPAHLLGVRPGDIITKINGEKVTGVDDMIKALETKANFIITVDMKDRFINLVIVPDAMDIKS